MRDKKNDLFIATKQVGLSTVQSESLWQALQIQEKERRKSYFFQSLIALGVMVLLFSLSWLYSLHLENGKAIWISLAYALIFFSSGAFLWHSKEAKTSGGILVTFGVLTVPLILFSLQKILHWPYLTMPNHEPIFWLQTLPIVTAITMTIVGSIVFSSIRYSFLTAIIYGLIYFLVVDAFWNFIPAQETFRLYYALFFAPLGLFLLSFRHSFWSDLFGLFFFCSSMLMWKMEFEWQYGLYFAVHVALLLFSSFSRRPLFFIFGSIGVIYYLFHLAKTFSQSFLYSSLFTLVGLAIIFLATTFYLKVKKKVEERKREYELEGR